jgi:ribonuclease HI
MLFGGRRREISEPIGRTTNNVAELTAILRALQELKRRDLPVRIHTDSSYCLGLLTLGWKPRANQELVAEIKSQMENFQDLAFVKVRGHTGLEGNERADALATRAAGLAAADG